MTTPTSPKAAQAVELKAKDLDGSGDTFCPNPQADMKLWNNHPRVFINVGRTGQGKCPYCGTEYRLKEGEVFAGGH